MLFPHQKNTKCFVIEKSTYLFITEHTQSETVTFEKQEIQEAQIQQRESAQLTSRYRTVQKAFRYVEPFRRGSRVRDAHGQ